jgi:hypothetical protein
MPPTTAQFAHREGNPEIKKLKVVKHARNSSQQDQQKKIISNPAIDIYTGGTGLKINEMHEE